MHEKASENPSASIGTLNENSLHASLKDWYAQPGDRLEAQLDGYHIDILRSDLLIEIQTRNFSAIRSKLAALCQNYPVCLVHPIIQTKWIQRTQADGSPVSRRKSPKSGQPQHLFQEMVRIPHLAAHPNFTLEIVIVHVEETWCDDGHGSWRRKNWSITDQKLLKVIGRKTFNSPSDYLTLLPPGLPPEFTNRDLSDVLRLPIRVSQRMTYTLQKMDALHITGKRGNAHTFQVRQRQDTTNQLNGQERR